MTASCSLSDYIVCSEATTLHTPFITLGISPEGCAEFTFPLRLAPGGPEAMLLDGTKVTAEEALRLGLVQEVVAGDAGAVLERGLAAARTFVSEGQLGRWELVPGFREEIKRLGGVAAFVAKLQQVNDAESVRLGQSIMSYKFFATQQEFAEKKGNTGMAWAFWIAKIFQPLVSKL